jgi:general L-amino acid transport system substrate-binding protein
MTRRQTIGIRTALGLSVFGMILAAAAPLHAQATAAAVLKKGFLQCGVNTGLAGFSQPDSNGRWHGIDVDVCRAVAAALFGDAAKVRYTPLNAQQRFTALQSGEIDLLSRNTSWTLARDAGLGINFAGINYYDGQGFMVPKKRGVKSAAELAGATVCVQPGTTTELNLADYFRAKKMKFKPVVIEKMEEVLEAYFAGRCDVYSTDVSGLIAGRASRAAEASEHVILAEVISKEPLGPVVRHGDDRWLDLVKWSLFAMIDAEDLGIGAKNIDGQVNGANPVVQRFAGATGALGKSLGVDRRWAYNIVKQVGNYGESFERHLTPIGIDRGLNRLWKHGGLMYAPPLR